MGMGEFGQYQLGASMPRKSRVSPVGSREYTADVNKWTSRGLVGNVHSRARSQGGGMIGATTGQEETAYDPYFWNSPTTQRHERIHIGQRRLEHQPTVEEVQDIFPQKGGPGRPHMERPAYRLAEDVYPQQAEVASQTAQAEAYINHLKTLGNPDRAISTIEVSLAPELQRRYLLGHRPPLPNPTPKELLR